MALSWDDSWGWSDYWKRTGDGGLYARKIKDMLARGADINASGEWGKTVLMAACRWPHAADAIKVLIENGARVDARDCFGQTVLMNAITYIPGHDDIDAMKVLIENGARVNAIDNYGRTALHYANRVEIAEMLIEAGADPYIEDIEGRDAIDFLRAENYYGGDKIARAILRAMTIENLKRKRREAERRDKVKGVLMAPVRGAVAAGRIASRFVADAVEVFVSTVDKVGQMIDEYEEKQSRKESSKAEKDYRLSKCYSASYFFGDLDEAQAVLEQVGKQYPKEFLAEMDKLGYTERRIDELKDRELKDRELRQSIDSKPSVPLVIAHRDSIPHVKATLALMRSIRSKINQKE